MAEIVYLQTTNPKKFAEYQRILGRHRVRVLIADTRVTVRELIHQAAGRDRVLAVMRETSDLFPAGSPSDQPNRLDEMNINGVLHELVHGAEGLSEDALKPLMPVENRTMLHVVTKGPEGILRAQVYQSVIEGFIADQINPPEGDDVFGWDDRFVSLGTQMTYQEMRNRGIKLSGRDLVLAQFTHDYLTFPERRDMKANPQKPERTIDFSRRMADFLRQDAYLNNSSIHLYGAKNSWVHAVNQGAFWQAASNRREGIYWNPGGNGGVPFTPKINKETGEADHLHEIEFLAHDLGHRWMCPDLVFEGDTDPLSIRVQTTWRMMSEALTLVNGSMLFMDTLKKSGIEYDYTRRKIYPLFESLQGDFANDPEALKKLFYANVRYALGNDEGVYRQMGANNEALDNYKSKYHAYFVEDYNWTQQNIRNMTADSERFRQWSQSVSPLTSLKKYLGGRLTVSECIDEMAKFVGKQREDLENMSQGELIDLMYNYVFETNIKPVLLAEPLEIDDDLALKSGFLKYMIAQLYIFEVYDFIPESTGYRERITNYLKEHIDTLTQEDIELLRAHYSQFVDLLFNRKAITQEDQQMYKEIFPHFPPHYIYYDRSAESYEPLDQVSQRIWNEA